jgi:hypothetical protein
MLLFLLYSFQFGTGEDKYQIFGVHYITIRYCYFFLYSVQYGTGKEKYISDFQCSLYFFKMFLILPRFIQY